MRGIGGDVLGDRLSELRRGSGLSQQQVASLVGVTRQTVSNWECGQGAPALDCAAELARIYGVSLDELAGSPASGARSSRDLGTRGATQPLEQLCAVTTSTAAELPLGMAERLGILRIPCSYDVEVEREGSFQGEGFISLWGLSKMRFEGVLEHFVDDAANPAAGPKLLAAIARGAAARACPPAAEQLVSAWGPILDSGRDVIHLSPSGALSREVEIARAAADQVSGVHDGHGVLVVDSNAVGPALGLIARSVAERRDDGMTAGEARAWTEENKIRADAWFVSGEGLPGRCSRRLVHLAADGSLADGGTCRGAKAAVEILLRSVRSGARGGSETGPALPLVTATDGASEEKQLVDGLVAWGLAEDGANVACHMGTLLATTLGKGAFGVAFWGMTNRSGR